jgi:hypothetical protein
VGQSFLTLESGGPIQEFTSLFLFHLFVLLTHWQVSCFVTPGYVKFMLLHNGKSEGSIKTFFEEVHELYIKILMNPFYEPNTPIESPVFYDRAKSIMQRRLF